MYFIKQFLNDRIFKAAINGLYSNNFTFKNGIPQGSPVSIFLFLVAINNIVNKYQNQKITLSADNSYTWIRHKHFKYIENRIQHCTNNLIKWEKTPGFSFSPEKSKYIIFSNGKFLAKPNIT